MLKLLRSLRFLFFSLPLILLLGAALPLTFLLLWLFDRVGRSQFQVARLGAWALLAAGFVRVHCTGAEKLQGLGPCLLVSNHPSYLDIPVLVRAIPTPFRFFAAGQLFGNPWMWILLRSGGHVRLDVSSGTLPFSGIKMALRLMSTRSHSILLFPEELHTGHALHPLRGGAAYLSIRAGVPVVPIALLGTRELLQARGAYLSSGDVTVRVGEPIPTRDLEDADRASLTQCLHERIADLLAQG